MIFLGAYLDESGTHQGSPICVMSGYMSRVENWCKFQPHWQEALRKKHVKVFHAFDCEEGTGEFAGWKTKKKNRLRKELAVPLKHFGVYAVSVAVVIADYEKVFLPAVAPSLLKVFRKPYMFCFRACVELCVNRLKSIPPEKRGGPLKLQFVFDRNSEMRKIAVSYFWDIIEAYGWGDLVVAIDFANKADAVPLQGADFLTNESFKHLRDSVGQGKKQITEFRSQLSRLLPNGTDRSEMIGGYHDAVELTKLVERMRQASDPTVR